jgi:hypothetical protein
VPIKDRPTHLDVALAFEVSGHDVTFSWLQWAGTAVISVDGAEVLRERQPLLGVKVVRRYTFQVGTQSVVIEKRRPQAVAGLWRAHLVSVFVDGVRLRT